MPWEIYSGLCTHQLQIKVILQKNRISTESKAAQINDAKDEVTKTLQTCLELLKAGEYVDADASVIDSDDLLLSTEELSTSPGQTLKLRYVIASQLFTSVGDSDKIGHADLLKLIDADPFLGTIDELKKANSVVPVADALKARNDWNLLKTDWASAISLMYHHGHHSP